MNSVFLLLGSNLGDRLLFIKRAIEFIETEVGPILKASAVYETQSWGKTNQPDYLNQVILLQSDMPPQEILKKILGIETVLGRLREEKWGARIIDIDISLQASLAAVGGRSAASCAVRIGSTKRF